MIITLILIASTLLVAGVSLIFAKNYLIHRTDISLDEIWTEHGWHDESVLTWPKRLGVTVQKRQISQNSDRVTYHVRYPFEWQGRFLRWQLNRNRAQVKFTSGQLTTVVTDRLFVRQHIFGASHEIGAYVLAQQWQDDGFVIAFKPSTGFVTLYGYRRRS